MENPFTKTKKSNKKLAIIAILLLGLIPTVYFGNEYKNQLHFLEVQEKNLYLIKQKDIDDKSIQDLKEALEKQIQDSIKDKETLKRLKVSHNIIKSFILKENPSISHELADNYATKIIMESNLRGNSPYIQAALLASESSFNKDPKHTIKAVIGMGGIYYTVWGEELKDSKIIASLNDLKDPYKNIEASSYILDQYKDSSKNTIEALTRYKGNCSLGAKQAKQVLAMANILKEKEKGYHV